MNRSHKWSLRICGTKTKYLTVVSLEFWKERRKKAGFEKVFQEVIPKTSPNLVKDFLTL
jgi:hypothetical protein